MVGPIPDQVPLAALVGVMVQSLRRRLKKGEAVVFFIGMEETGSQVAFIVCNAVRNLEAKNVRVKVDHGLHVVSGDDKVLKSRREGVGGFALVAGIYINQSAGSNRRIRQTAENLGLHIAQVARGFDERLSRLLVEVNKEQNAAMALDLASSAFVMENGKVVMHGRSDELRADKDVQEFYLGIAKSGTRSYRQVKLYRRRKRWLS